MKTRLDVESEINAYIVAQEYFNKSSANYRKAPIRVGREIDPEMSAFGLEPIMKYPIYYIGFGRDYIEIGEQKEDARVINRTTFMRNQNKFNKYDDDNSNDVSVPSISFPNKLEYKFIDYSSPYDLSDDILDKFKKDINCIYKEKQK